MIMAEAKARCALVTALIPIHDTATIDDVYNEFDSSYPLTVEILVPEDVMRLDEWSQFAEVGIRQIAATVTDTGWPKLSPESSQITVDEPVDEPPPETAAEQAADPNSGGRCWNCHEFLITTARGTFCPHGCPETAADEVELDIEEQEAADPAFDGALKRADGDPVRRAIRNDDLDFIDEIIERMSKIYGLTPVDNPVDKSGTESGAKNPPKDPPKHTRVFHSPNPGSGTMLDPYESTPESPRPTSFPQGPAIPTTD